MSQEDKDRLPADLLFNLYVEDVVALSEGELARFTPEQRLALEECETAAFH